MSKIEVNKINMWRFYKAKFEGFRVKCKSCGLELNIDKRASDFKKHLLNRHEDLNNDELKKTLNKGLQDCILWEDFAMICNLDVGCNKYLTANFNPVLKNHVNRSTCGVKNIPEINLTEETIWQYLIKPLRKDENSFQVNCMNCQKKVYYADESLIHNHLQGDHFDKVLLDMQLKFKARKHLQNEPEREYFDESNSECKICKCVVNQKDISSHIRKHSINSVEKYERDVQIFKHCKKIDYFELWCSLCEPKTKVSMPTYFVDVAEDIQKHIYKSCV